MKFRVTVGDGIDLIVEADKEVDAVRKAKTVKDALSFVNGGDSFKDSTKFRDSLTIKKGDKLQIEARGKTFNKEVFSVEANYGTDEDPDWYLEFTDGTTMHQKTDGAKILSVNGKSVKDSNSKACLNDITNMPLTVYREAVSEAARHLEVINGKYNEQDETTVMNALNGAGSAVARAKTNYKKWI